MAGRGGMGTVWRAHDELLNRRVALKEIVLPAGQGLDRIIREARAMAQLRHDGVMSVHDIVVADERPWLVMEYLDAPNLKQLIEAAGHLSPQYAAEVGRRILSVLRAAHDAGFLHRDVKPSNILLGADGRIVLTDFGLAVDKTAVYDSGMTLDCSPAYVSPEQAMGEPVDEASDLWSLGATLYTAVEGHEPYKRADPLASMLAVLVDDYVPPVHAGPLRPVIDGLLRRSPDQRLTSMETCRLLDRMRTTSPRLLDFLRPLRTAARA
ncbi:MAG: serine/threonine-protein kinase [Streptosporangiaceae bacterium]